MVFPIGPPHTLHKGEKSAFHSILQAVPDVESFLERAHLPWQFQSNLACFDSLGRQ